MIDYKELPINNIIYDIIKPNSRVLDIGCGNGVLGGTLRRNKNCYVCGLEIDPELVKLAEKQLDSVINTDIQDLQKLSLNRGYDYVVCADILEHIPNPIPVLNMIKRFLTPKGYLLVSIPNIANWRIRMRLLIGRFEYESLTITDPGHMWFYTKTTAKRLLEGCGYRVIKIFSKNSAYKRDFLMKFLGRLWGNLFAYQFVFVARG